MLFSDIAIINGNLEVEEHRYVGTRDGIIAYIGSEPPREDFGEVYAGRHKVLMSGFYNAHAHAPMTLLRGYAENLPLDRWLNEMVFPFEALISDEAAYAATQLAVAEMLRYGTVSFTDMYYFSDARAHAVIDTGVKCNLSEGVVGFEVKPYAEMPVSKLNEHLITSYDGAHAGRLKMDVCIHAEYTTFPDLVEAIGQVAVDHQIGTHIHLSETRTEHEECQQRHGGLTPAAYFESLGFFRTPCTAAHCVWVTEDDMDILRTNGVTVATCPVSNLKLASGVAPVTTMLQKGVSVALGTDGVASNNNHDILQDLYVFSLIHKGITGDPTVITPAEALRIATRQGALAQRRPDCGSLELGYHADLIVIDTDKPHLYPATHLLSNLVYAAHGDDVCLTMVDGEILYRDGEFPTIDVERAQYETSQATAAIIAQLASSKR
jgi:5-methylthioadenosine/S-adenosylhomocysteine deaminase